MYGISSLFETVYFEESGEKYARQEVKQAAKPYIDYLKRVQKWHKGRSVSWKVRRPDKDEVPGARGGQNRPRGRGKLERHKGVPVSLDEVDDADIRRIISAAETLGHVYDYDPNEGLKVNKKDMINITSIDEDNLLVWLERDPAKPYLKAERNTYQTMMMIRAIEVSHNHTSD